MRVSGVVCLVLLVGCGDPETFHPYRPKARSAPASEAETSPSTSGSRSTPASTSIEEPETRADLLEGDIVAPPAPAGVAANRRESRAWPKGIIPFALPGDFEQPERITDAIAHWEARTSIRFVKRTNETAYVNVVTGDGCSSMIGFTGAKQDLTLGPTCNLGNAIHELGHAVGLWHEQSRSDRDDFVTVLLENVAKGQEHNFDKMSQPSVGPYDINSIMHYGSTYFSAEGKPTLLTKDGRAIVPNRIGLSYGDIAGVKALYDRPPAPANIEISWNKKSDTAEYSLDITLSGGKFIGPCVSAASLKRSLKHTFDGNCTDPGTKVSIDEIVDIRICWAENGDWAHASCAGVPYDNAAVVELPN